MNKETLQNYNTRLTTNNTSLNNILNVINELPEIVETKLQDKSITITENGTQNITFDEGYDGLNSVEVTTNIESGGGGKYTPSYISFYGYTGTNLDYELENLDLSNLTTLSNMFYNCTKLKEITLNNVNVPLADSAQGMFYSCSSLETLNISGWNVPLLTETRNMFMMCSKLTTINIKNWNTPKLTSLYSTFSSCSQLQEVDLTGWDMSNVTNMRGTFGSCSQLKSVIFPESLNGSKVTNMLALFSGCSSLQHIDMRNCDFSNVTSSGSMFNNVPVDCEIIVKDDTAKSFVLTQRSDFTNVKTVAEL